MEIDIHMNIEKISVGKVLKPQGIKGEVKVLPLTDLEALAEIKAVYLQGETEPRRVERCAVRGGYAFILLSGVPDRNAAEALRGKELYAEIKEVKLKKGVYFVRDIIGCTLLDSGGAVLGAVTNIDNYGSADVYTAESGGRVFRFPFIKALKSKVDLANKTVSIDKKVFEEICIYED